MGRNFGKGHGFGHGMGGEGKFARDNASTQTIDADDRATVLYILEEEKMAGDLYEIFQQQTGLSVFGNIAKSEDRHFNAMLKQAEKLGLDVDEIVFKPAGSYVNDEVQQMYDDLLAQGSQSAIDALEVGRYIEQTDATDLREAMDDVAGTQLARVYGNLLDGSLNHLDAFDALLG